MIDDVLQRQVAEMTREGMSAKRIGLTLNLSERHVQRIRKAAGVARVPSTRITDEAATRAKRMLDDGCSYPEAARTVGCSADALRNRFPGHAWTMQQVAQHAVFCRRNARLLK